MLDSEDRLRQVMSIRGALGATVVDSSTGTVVCSAGRMPGEDHASVAAGVADVVQATLASTAFATVGRPGRFDDIVVTAANGYHLVRFVESGCATRLVFYLWLDRQLGNLAMAQRQLSATAAGFIAG